METVNLNQLTANENGIYLLVNTPFSGFAIETFPDGSLQTQVALMHGLQDGVTRRWHPNGQLESEQHFRNGKPHGWHRKWQSDGTLQAEFAWTADIRGGGAAGAGTPMTEPSETTYVYDAQGRQTAVIYGPVNAAGVEETVSGNPKPATALAGNPGAQGMASRSCVAHLTIREDQLVRSLSHCGECSCIHLSQYCFESIKKLCQTVPNCAITRVFGSKMRVSAGC